ncbi:MAG: hypothetical protein CMJ86_09475 [Planctomycetes bacterium]|nr:hypothetical protein [Planctomycetota bacterium]
MTSPTPRGLRWTIWLLSTLLFFLFIWLQGFVLEDINDQEGPDRQRIQNEHIEAELVERESQLKRQARELERDIARQEEIKTNRQESMSVAQRTWNQFAQEHRRVLDSGRQPPAELSTTLKEAQTLYMKATDEFEEANTKISDLQQIQHTIALEQETLDRALSIQRGDGYSAYMTLYRAHRWRVAAGKLSFVVPLFVLASWLVARKRKSIYRPVMIALLVSSFLRVGLVMHEHFPAEFFKYVGIIASVIIVLGFLVHALRSAATPKEDVLLRRRREAYQKNCCPECAYTVPDEEGTTMACAACGVDLFTVCDACDGIRHELLPHCRHCGAQSERWRGVPAVAH